MWKSRAVAVVAIAASIALAGCSSSSPKTGSASSPKSVTLTVLAASSLTNIGPTLASQFTATHPGVTVTYSFGGSATLASQITQGAPADVFLSASPAAMATVTQAGDVVGTPQNFIANQLVIAVAPGNPKGIKGLSDLTKPGLKVILCDPSQPCGSAAQKALTAANVTLKPASLAPDVKSALSTVELGEADAALVYRSDAKGSGGKVDGIEFPESAQAINEYPAAALKGSKNLADAQAFVAFMASPTVQQQLIAAGFQAP